MIRVLYLDPAPFAGGAQESLLSAVLAIPGEERLCLFSKGLAKRAMDAGLSVRPISTRHWPASLPGLLQFCQDARKTSPILRQALRDFQPDCIHANTLRAGMLLAWNPPACPIFLHDRDCKAPRLLRKWLFQRLHPRILAISSNVARCWDGISENTQVLPNGFDVDGIASTRPQAWSDGNFAVIQVADLEAWKNHRLFLEAIALAAPRCPGLRALIKGRLRSQDAQSYLASLQSTIRERKLEGIVHIDTAPVSALPCLAASDVLVSCSENEPFGRTIIEALALGKPVLATTSAAAPELLENNPAAVRCQASPEALADSILAWAPAEKRMELSAPARDFARRFSLQRHVSELHILHLSLKAAK